MEMERAEKEREKYEQEKARIAAMRETSTKDESGSTGVVNFRELGAYPNYSIYLWGNFYVLNILEYLFQLFQFLTSGFTERKKREEREQMLKKLAEKQGTSTPTSSSASSAPSSGSPTKPVASGPSKSGSDFGTSKPLATNRIIVKQIFLGFTATLKGEGSKAAKVNDLAVFTVQIQEKGRLAKVKKDEDLQIVFEGPDSKVRSIIKGPVG
jgi:hypothetical protein